MSFKLKIFVLLFGVALLPLFFLTSYMQSVTERALTQATLNQLNSIASIQETRLDDITEYYEDVFAMIKSRTKLRMLLKDYNETGNTDDIPLINRILTDASVSVESVRGVLLMSKEGTDIGSSQKDNFEHAYPCFLDAKENGFVHTFYEYGGTTYLTFAGSLHEEDEFQGVLIVYFNMDRLNDITSDYTGLGKSGESLVAKRIRTDDAMFINPLRFDENAAFTRTIGGDEHTHPINIALEKKEGLYQAGILDYRNVSVLAATRYFEKYDWGVVVKIDQAEIQGTLNRSYYIILFSLIGMIGLVYFLSRYVVLEMMSMSSKKRK